MPFFSTVGQKMELRPEIRNHPESNSFKPLNLPNVFCAAYESISSIMWWLIRVSAITAAVQTLEITMKRSIRSLDQP
ncbi:hypothetical protein F4212_01220 [Candidatus Poribacteria bacterium]|nr:hypothetical protein [Candidatus Poribacteria bacterium]